MTGLVAGCAENDYDDVEDIDDQDGIGNGDDGNGDDENGDDGNGDDGNGDDGNGDDGNGDDENGDDENGDDGNGDDETGDDGDGEGLEPGTQIEFEATTADWTGIAPDSIAGESNPTLTLREGETYEIGWTEGDGAGHNLELRNDDGEVVDDLSTEIVVEPGDDQWLEFEASEEIIQYVCNPHESTMVGDIEVV